ncbi:MAG: hypothetical protein WC570_03075 [Patescibacteria group bacterium]
MMKETMNEETPAEEIKQLLSDKNYHHLAEVKKLGGEVVGGYIDQSKYSDGEKRTMHKFAKMTGRLLGEKEIESFRRDQKGFTTDFLKEHVADLTVDDLENTVKFAKEYKEKNQLESGKNMFDSHENIIQIEAAGKKLEEYLNKFNDVAGKFYSEATRIVIPKILPLGEDLNKVVVKFAQLIESVAFNKNLMSDHPEYGKRLGKGYNPINNFQIGLKFFGDNIGRVLQTKEEKEATLQALKDVYLGDKKAA